MNLDISQPKFVPKFRPYKTHVEYPSNIPIVDHLQMKAENLIFQNKNASLNAAVNRNGVILPPIIKRKLTLTPEEIAKIQNPVAPQIKLKESDIIQNMDIESELPTEIVKEKITF